MDISPMYNVVYIYVPAVRQLVIISEGSGQNLWPDDEADGYVDYIYYTQHAVADEFPECDGGQVLLTEMFREKYKSTSECIPDVLDMAYGNRDLPYIVL